jgi:hypothetical protein
MGKPRLRKWLDANHPLVLNLANEKDSQSLIVAYAVSLLKGISEVFSYKLRDGDNLFSESLKDYDTDECLFEVLCYVLYRVDVWLFAMEYHEFRQKVFYPTIVDYCLSPFRSYVKGENLNAIFDNRMDVYARINREEQDIALQLKKEVHFLTQYLYHTLRHKKVQTYDPTNAPLIIGGITDMFGVQTVITSYIEAFYPWHKETIQLIIKRMIELGQLSSTEVQS